MLRSSKHLKEPKKATSEPQSLWQQIRDSFQALLNRVVTIRLDTLNTRFMILFVVMSGIIITTMGNFVFETYRLYVQSSTDDVLRLTSQLILNSPPETISSPSTQRALEDNEGAHTKTTFISDKAQWIEGMMADQSVQIWVYERLNSNLHPVPTLANKTKASPHVSDALIWAHNRFKPSAMALSAKFDELKPFNAQTIRLQNQSFRVLVLPEMSHSHQTWVAALPLKRINAVRASFLGTLQWVVISILVGTCLLVFWVTQTITRPVRRLIDQIHATHFDNPDVALIEQNGVSEVHQLVEAFNLMIQRIRTEQQELQQFVVALTHDLKVPLLAEMQAFDYWRRGIYGPVQSEQYTVLDALQQANRSALDLMTNLLDLHRFERGQVHWNEEPIAVQPLFEELLKEITPAAQGKRITLTSECENVQVLADSPALRRVFYNLLVNALAYTPRGGTIACSGIAHPTHQQVQQSNFEHSSIVGTKPFQSNYALIQVEDSGIGFAPMTLEEVFTTVPRSQKRTPLSSSLGLYNCYQTITGLGGHIWLESTEGQGTLVKILLPRVDKDSL